MEEFATSTHTDTTMAAGRTRNPSEIGKNTLAYQYADIASEIIPAAVSIFQMWLQMSITADMRTTRTVVEPVSVQD